jgi:pimeloyl-ACP methyl ester carboxylesterase
VWATGVAVTLVVLALTPWYFHRAHPWQPPKGGPDFASCSYGGYLRGARCADVAVPEDPAKPSGKTVRLHVAVVPATRQPAAGALFYLEGGPGGAATAAALRVNEDFAKVGRTRDLVMVDQRGTGGSAPLACPAERVRADNAAAVTAYLRRCFADLHGTPLLDTTSTAADDLDAVRRVLGYDRIDLYGGSYGAMVAQEYLHRFPKNVRSVVLDSGSLPSVHVYDASAGNAQRALDEVLDRCGSACRNSGHDLRQLLARGPRHVALSTGKVTLQSKDVAWTIASLSETPDSAASIPSAIDAATHGEYTPLAIAYTHQLGANLDRRGRLAMFWVILCSERWAAFDPATTARDGEASYLEPAAVARARLFRQACRAVPKAAVAPVPETPTRVPVLLLAGSADPVEPAANLRGWRRVFPNGRLVVVTGAGHGTIAFGCVQTLVARFVAAARARDLDASCARHVPLPPIETG